MKKVIIIISVVLSCSKLYSQDSKVDVYELIKYYQTQISDTNQVARENAENKIWNIGIGSKKQKHRELAVNILLDMFYITKAYSPFDFKRSDFNIEAKRKIISLLTEPKPKQIIDLFLHDETNEFIRQKSKRIENDAKKIIKKTGQNYTEVYDSIFKSELKSYLDRMVFYFKDETSSSLYLAIGWLEMRDQIPFLESQLKDSIIRSKSNYDDLRMCIKAALVRMGLHQYYDSDVKGCPISGWYLRHQEAYKLWINRLYSDEKYNAYGGALEESTTIFEASNAIELMQISLTNFPKKYWLEIDGDYVKNKIKTLKYLQAVRKWAKENEGKYKFNPECDLN